MGIRGSSFDVNYQDEESAKNERLARVGDRILRNFS